MLWGKASTTLDSEGLHCGERERERERAAPPPKSPRAVAIVFCGRSKRTRYFLCGSAGTSCFMAGMRVGVRVGVRVSLSLCVCFGVKRLVLSVRQAGGRPCTLWVVETTTPTMKARQELSSLVETAGTESVSLLRAFSLLRPLLGHTRTFLVVVGDARRRTKPPRGATNGVTFCRGG